MFKAQPKDQDAILSNVNYKTVESISELIRAGIDTATSEANACKKLVDSLTGEITKLRETQEFLKMELTKDINDKYKPIEVKMTAYVENHDAQLKAVNDRINSFASEVIDSKKYNSDISKNDLRPFTNNITKNTEKIGELELEQNKLAKICSELAEKIEPAEFKLRTIDDVMADVKDQFRTWDDRLKMVESRL